MVCFLYAFTEASTKSHLAFAQDLPYGDNSIGFTTTQQTRTFWREVLLGECVLRLQAHYLSIPCRSP